MQGNGIGPLVSQLVHERNAQRAAARSGSDDAEQNPVKSIKPHPHADTVEFSEAALARFEALKTRLVGEEPAPVEDPGTVADVEPTRSEPAEPIAPVDESGVSAKLERSTNESLLTPRLSFYA